MAVMRHPDDAISRGMYRAVLEQRNEAAAKAKRLEVEVERLRAEYADLLEVHSRNEELSKALRDLLDRQNDYPTDLSRDPEWSAAFARGREALGNG